MLLYNLLLALAWVLITGRYDPPNFIFGFLLGFLLLWGSTRAWTEGKTAGSESLYFRRVFRVLVLIWVFFFELLVSGLRVAWMVIQPRPKFRPGIYAVPIDLGSDAELTVLASLLTLTPGSLTLEVSEDRRMLYVHAFDVDDPERFRVEIKDRFERRVREAFG